MSNIHYYEGPDGGLCKAANQDFTKLEGFDEITEAQYEEFRLAKSNTDGGE